jgi:protein TonB
MLAYAAGRPKVAENRASPNAMLAIIAAHVALVAVVMSARMDLPQRLIPEPIEIRLIPSTPPPPENLIKPTPKSHATPLPLPPEPPPLQRPEATITGSAPIFPSSADPVGPVAEPIIHETAIPTPAPVRSGPRLLTPASELRPPYPVSKLLTEEEAVLVLRLSIDERGRVVAVDPVGRADPVFLVAARRYLVAHWRYKPASRDGTPVASSTVITLKFQLDG